MCRVSLKHTWKHRISTKTLLERMELKPITHYLFNRILRWTGNVVRQSRKRMPRKMLTAWVPHKRKRGGQELNFGRTLKKALTFKKIPTEFDKWSKIAIKEPQRWLEMTNVVIWK